MRNEIFPGLVSSMLSFINDNEPEIRKKVADINKLLLILMV
jgi:hypothetical protein